MGKTIEEKIVEAIQFIKSNSPILHLYICGKLLETQKRNIKIRYQNKKSIRIYIPY